MTRKLLHCCNGNTGNRGSILTQIKCNLDTLQLLSSYAIRNTEDKSFMLKNIWFVFLCVLCAFCLDSCNSSSTVGEEGPSPPKTPEDELATIVVEPGMKIQLVASEPMVQDPVVITFDEDGRLWVVEMRGFMPDIDGKGERERIGRVSVLQDTNNDGMMDSSIVYIDSLIMPRALALVSGGALIVEEEALWLTQDTNHDLKADTKTLIDPDYAGTKMPEHSGNGLWRGLDNWYYNVKSRFRYKLIEGKWTRDSTEFRGQWGLSHDDVGRLYYNYNWSQLHADLVPPNYLGRNKNHTPTTGIDHGLTLDRRVYPIRANPAVNRGYIPGTLDEQGRLLEFTAACSPLYYRATTLPMEFYGNVFVCEPSGNLIKRNVVRENGFLLSAYDPHPGTEFVASTDERFRPVHLTSGPDGGLYIADMYRGLVQHGAYVTPYLREQTLTRKLVQPVHYGRIWRVVPENWKPSPVKKLSAMPSTELITYLSNENGWYRDMAQRLLVERNEQNINTQLATAAKNGGSTPGRLHALWTMEGLKIITPDFLMPLLSDPDQQIRIHTLRLLEPFAKKDQKVRAALQEMVKDKWKDAPPAEILQLSLTAGILDSGPAQELLAGIVDRYDTSALIRDAVLSSLEDQEYAFLKNLMASGLKMQTPGKEIFLEMLTTSIVRKRNPAELSSLLTMLDVAGQDFGWKEKTILTAISIQGNNRKLKPIRLSKAPRILTSSKDKMDDTTRLNALNGMFEWPGHVVDTASRRQINRLSDAEQQQFALGRQHYLTTCAGCHGTDGGGMNRMAPTLIGSDWVLGDEKRLALILLHGIEGPIEVAGKVYDVPEILPVMPSHSTMDDAAITAIMTYIRNEWGNSASAVGRRTVGSTRHTTQGRVVPWTAKELNEHLEKESRKENATQQ
jgi:mono/diheme cytochrome c family protein/glucose/arabinose dehydrogenase